MTDCYPGPLVFRLPDEDDSDYEDQMILHSAELTPFSVIQDNSSLVTDINGHPQLLSDNQSRPIRVCPNGRPLMNPPKKKSRYDVVIDSVVAQIQSYLDLKLAPIEADIQLIKTALELMPGQPTVETLAADYQNLANTLQNINPELTAGIPNSLDLRFLGNYTDADSEPTDQIAVENESLGK